MSAVTLFIPAKGPLVRLPIGRPLGVDLVGGRETLGERVILDGARRWSCAMDRVGSHVCKRGLRVVSRDALSRQKRQRL